MIPSRSLRALALAVPLCALATPCFADDSFKEVQSRISEFTLKNGWKFIVLERHQAPVASFYTYAYVGAVQESSGSTGLAIWQTGSTVSAVIGDGLAESAFKKAAQGVKSRVA